MEIIWGDSDFLRDKGINLPPGSLVVEVPDSGSFLGAERKIRPALALDVLPEEFVAERRIVFFHGLTRLECVFAPYDRRKIMENDTSQAIFFLVLCWIEVRQEWIGINYWERRRETGEFQCVFGPLYQLDDYWAKRIILAHSISIDDFQRCFSNVPFEQAIRIAPKYLEKMSAHIRRDRSVEKNEPHEPRCPKCGEIGACYWQDDGSVDQFLDRYFFHCTNCSHEENRVLDGGEVGKSEKETHCPFCNHSAVGHQPLDLAPAHL